LSKKKFKKHSRAIKNEHELAEKTAGLVYAKHPVKNFRYFIALPVLLAVAAGIYLIYSSYKTNGYFGFPLDDPWIHLTFAKNLIEYGSFSYFKNELITSGSTSPVYTLLLSLFYFFSKNEFIISYTVGILFGALTVFAIIKLSLLQFKNFELLAILAALLIALQPKLNLINVSGMETSMFIFLLIASLFAYRDKRIILLGILLGLTIWCRPEGFVLWIAVALDYMLRKTYLKKNDSILIEKNFTSKEIIISFSIALVLTAAYFGFNYFLSGALLPNTFKAKTEYYSRMDRAFFLENDVIKYFSESEFILIWLPFLFYLGVIIRSVIKREYNSYLVFILFIAGLIGVYYLKLPFSHRFGRYLMPVIPLYILIAIAGIKTITDYIHTKSVKSKTFLPNSIFLLYFAAVLGIFIHHTLERREEFTMHCKYQNDRHVTAGRWIKENTEPSSVIATHDIGAIAFYGERKIIDMAGLVTPELIERITDEMYSEYLNNYLAEHKVDYIAGLRNWFEIVNDKPVFTPVNSFEFLDVFKYNPGRTHIQPKEVSKINQAAFQLMQNSVSPEVLYTLHQSLSLDSKSSQTHFLLGAAYASIKDYPNAEKHFKSAVELFPDFAEAQFGLGKVYFDQNKLEESNRFINKCLEINPDYIPAVQLKNRLAVLINK
jgi:tetratricopeptide (TPR) repeat protein